MTGEHESEAVSPLRKSKKRDSEQNLAASVFTEYCSSTSIHGIGYLGAADKSLAEKIWWIIVLVVSVTCCAILISRTWTKWQENPVIVSFSQEQTPLWAIPFPAVTICPLNKIRQSRYNYTDYYKRRDNLTEKYAKEFWDLSLICNLKFIFKHNASKDTDLQVFHSINKYAPAVDETINYYVWKGHEEYTGSDYFARQMTEEGLCFTFNSLSQKDLYTDAVDSKTPYIERNSKSEGWSIERGYPRDSPMDTYPERTMQDGSASGLSIQLYSLSYNTELVCGHPVSGFKILLHNPAETPRVTQQYVLAPLKKQITISVKPNMITTSRGLLNIPVQTRNCYFEEERQLKYFRFYTQNNCRSECLANVTKVHCGCVPFHLARDANTSICGYGNVYCMAAAQKMIFKYDMLRSRNKVTEEIRSKDEYRVYSECNCIPACASLDYSSETSLTDFHFVQHYQQAEDFDLPLTYLDVTQVDIFFQESQFLALHRSELYGQTDFLANCGGLLGLFMGFSFLSLLEIIYYLTIRVWCRIKIRKSKKPVFDDFETIENTKF